jgi:RNA polymerase sigma-70 factor, ECF subfamily
VFYRMLRSRHTFTGEGDFKTWMYFIARNVIRDHVKKTSRDPGYHDMNELADKIGADMRTDEQIERKLEIKSLQQAMDSLSRDSREILILSRFQELRHEEIARVLDISVGAVKVRIHRAINQLKERYQSSEAEK